MEPELYTTASTSSSFAASGFMLFFSLFIFLIAILVIVGLWKIFKKAGQPGWAAIIPFYNLYITLKVAGMSGWWFWAFFIPFLNIIAMIIMWYNVGKAFGKGIGFAIGLILFGFIFIPILGFGSAQYVGASGNDQQPQQPQNPPQQPQQPPQNPPQQQ